MAAVDDWMAADDNVARAYAHRVVTTNAKGGMEVGGGGNEDVHSFGEVSVEEAGEGDFKARGLTECGP